MEMSYRLRTGSGTSRATTRCPSLITSVGSTGTIQPDWGQRTSRQYR